MQQWAAGEEFRVLHAKTAKLKTKEIIPDNKDL